MGYEDPDSVKFKTDFIKASGLGGGMVWATDMDDFRNMCGHGANPMLRLIYEELKDYVVPPSPTRPPTTKVRGLEGDGMGEVVVFIALDLKIWC